MRLITSTWRQLPDNALVIDPAGRIWQLTARTAGNVAHLRCVEGAETAAFTVDPDGAVQSLTSGEQAAVMVLSRFFDLERI